ncbi:MAG: undecaprenyldiphospho-muramoylpentapeptide beta-N-acetylglucosaminyltransferase [Acidobacteriota bacterium]|nr:undecaprenyldiphospho-muramoylpentapeptide beta-N-acetylglucosaminyltransferase [Acidobacteriota bacterium]
MISRFAGARVLLAGGGSAGHVNPLLAVAAALKDRGIEAEALGTSQGLESDLVPEAGLKLNTIQKVPAPRRPNKAALRFLPDLRQTVKDVEKIIEEGGIEAVVGFGGYVSAPAYLAARNLGVPVAIHEQNARPGLANKLGARFADAVGVTFENTPLKARKGITETVGLPLRPQIQELARQRTTVESRVESREKAARALGLDPRNPIMLITGGSLGAKKLNDVMVGSADAFQDRHQIIHLTGKGKSEGMEEAVRKSGFKGTWIIKEYATDIENLFAAADLVVSRSGAGMVAELTALGLPAVYVPLPIGNGEQRLNATEQYEAGGALIFPDKDFNNHIVRTHIAPLLDSGDRLAKMANNSRRLGRIDASERMADIVEAVLSPKLGVH